MKPVQPEEMLEGTGQGPRACVHLVPAEGRDADDLELQDCLVTWLHGSWDRVTAYETEPERDEAGRHGELEKGRSYGCSMVDIGPAGEVGALMTALRREIDSDCLVRVWQLRGPTHAIRYVVDGGGSPLLAGQTRYYDVVRSRSIAQSEHRIRPRTPER